MIAVSVRMDGIQISGHANYSYDGYDIVCAGVTALTQTLIKSIEDLAEDEIEYEISPGEVDIHYGNLSEKAKTLVDSFFIGICVIAGEFPDNVRIAQHDVSEMTLNYDSMQHSGTYGMEWGRKRGNSMKFKDNQWRIPMTNLQLFADGDGGGSGTGDGGGAGAGTGAGSVTEQMSFDDFLKLEGNQAEFDRRVQKATQTAVSNAQQKWKTLTDDKVSEAEKLAQMTKEERAEYKAQKLQKELDDYKKKETLSEMSKTARKMLADEEINIPDELLSHLVSDSAEDTKASVESFVKLYKAAVQAAVKDALKGNPPKAGTGGNQTMTKEQIMAVKNPSERQRLIAENITLFQ